MKWRQFRRVLERAPLNYGAPSTGTGGSHTLFTSTSGYPDLRLAFHDSATLSPGMVRKILMKDVGLSEEDARALL